MTTQTKRSTQVAYEAAQVVQDTAFAAYIAISPIGETQLFQNALAAYRASVVSSVAAYNAHCVDLLSESIHRFAE